MKKILFVLVVLLCLFTVLGCDDTSNEEMCKHAWGEWQFNDESHWRYYTCGHDSPEVAGEHTWDDGVEVEGGYGAYLMEYTCTVCGKKTQSIITIIPPQTPVSNLEFWISENVDNVDFSGYQEKYGLFGGREYYGTGYVPTIDEYGQQVDPERCVIYTVTSYPDYSDKEQHVTGIYITDPQITFCGISLNSSFYDFELLIKEQGFEITSANENHRTASKGKYSVTITREWIRIRVEVENKDGIIF